MSENSVQAAKPKPSVTAVRVSKSIVGQDEIDAVSRVMSDGFLGMGTEVQAFEADIARFLGTDGDVICVSTGTAALQLALQSAGVTTGDEVLVPSLTYVASYQAITATGATPVSCDVREDTGLIDLEDASQRLTPRTRAILPVHYASNTAGRSELKSFAKAHDLRIVEDAAHSFGCRDADGNLIGTDGDLVCFSFDGIKNITSGEGGAVVSFSAESTARIQDARLLGVEKDTEKRYSNSRSWNFDVVEQGWRYHMSNIMAAIGRVQLGRLAEFAEARRSLAKRYQDRLRDVAGIELLNIDYDGLIPHIFPVRIVASGTTRDVVASELSSAGFQTGIHYMPNHLLSKFKTPYALPVAERLGQELISLPLHPGVTFEEQDQIIAALTDIVAGG